MKFLVTGAGGQKRMAKDSESHPAHEFVALNRQELDICDPDSIARAHTHKPRVCINVAAYTHVDLAETQHEQAFRGNVLGPKLLAEACGQS